MVWHSDMVCQWCDTFLFFFVVASFRSISWAQFCDLIGLDCCFLFSHDVRCACTLVFCVFVSCFHAILSWMLLNLWWLAWFVICYFCCLSIALPNAFEMIVVGLNSKQCVVFLFLCVFCICFFNIGGLLLHYCKFALHYCDSRFCMIVNFQIFVFHEHAFAFLFSNIVFLMFLHYCTFLAQIEHRFVLIVSFVKLIVNQFDIIVSLSGIIVCSLFLFMHFAQQPLPHWLSSAQTMHILCNHGWCSKNLVWCHEEEASRISIDSSEERATRIRADFFCRNSQMHNKQKQVVRNLCNLGGNPRAKHGRLPLQKPLHQSKLLIHRLQSRLLIHRLQSRLLIHHLQQQILLMFRKLVMLKVSMKAQIPRNGKRIAMQLRMQLQQRRQRVPSRLHLIPWFQMQMMHLSGLQKMIATISDEPTRDWSLKNKEITIVHTNDSSAKSRKHMKMTTHWLHMRNGCSWWNKNQKLAKLFCKPNGRHLAAHV